MGITHLCFGFSYLAVSMLELAGWAKPQRGLRVAALVFALAGLIAHTIFLIFQQPTPAAPYGSLLLLGWVMAVFYVYGTLHTGSRAWSVFFLPLLLGLVWLAYFGYREAATAGGTWFSGSHFWGMVHGGLLLAASVGITAAAVASLMYLVQANRLKRKRNPMGGLKLLSLESLERINRRSINIAFPLLTVGLLLGVIRVGASETVPAAWTALKIIATLSLWFTALVLLFLRYRANLPGRRLAYLTLAAFGLLLASLLASHPFAPGGST
jgi:ABC-type transport system involved in cytochrome c biogenesis permease subunit